MPYLGFAFVFVALAAFFVFARLPNFKNPEAPGGGFGVGSDFTWQLFGGYSFDFPFWQSTMHGVVGYRALAVNLRGHRGSATSKPLRKCSIADYVDDVASVADTLQARPVVIGHSMGGFVVQKYLESHEAPAGVLVASFPPGGSA